MTATASKVNASIARHSLSVLPGGTISPRITIPAISGPNVAIPVSRMPFGVRSTVSRSVRSFRTICCAIGGSSARSAPLRAERPQLGRAGEPKKLVVLKGYRHYEVYLEPAFSEVMRATVAWYRQYLPAREG